MSSINPNAKVFGYASLCWIMLICAYGRAAEADAFRSFLDSTAAVMWACFAFGVRR